MRSPSYRQWLCASDVLGMEGLHWLLRHPGITTGRIPESCLSLEMWCSACPACRLPRLTRWLAAPRGKHMTPLQWPASKVAFPQDCTMSAQLMSLSSVYSSSRRRVGEAHIQMPSKLILLPDSDLANESRQRSS